MRLWLRSKLTFRAISAPPPPSLPLLGLAGSTLRVGCRKLTPSPAQTCAPLPPWPSVCYLSRTTWLAERKWAGRKAAKLQVGGWGGREEKRKQLDATRLEFELCSLVTARPYACRKEKQGDDGNLIRIVNLLMGRETRWWSLLPVKLCDDSNTTCVFRTQ